LFRKVVTSEISPWELVRMSTEKLASDELAQWREKTIKKVSVNHFPLSFPPSILSLLPFPLPPLSLSEPRDDQGS
jgi:hypothetical protein